MVGQRGLLFLGTGFSVAGRLRSRDSRSECALPCMVRGYFFVPCGRWLAGLSFTKRLRITRAANADLALLLVFCRPIGCRTLVLQPLKAARLPRVHRHSLACSLSRRGLFGGGQSHIRTLGSKDTTVPGAPGFAQGNPEPIPSVMPDRWISAAPQTARCSVARLRGHVVRCPGPSTDHTPQPAAESRSGKTFGLATSSGLR